MPSTNVQLQWLSSDYAGRAYTEGAAALIAPINELLACLDPQRRIRDVVDLIQMLESSLLLLAWDGQMLIGMATLVPMRRLGQYHGYIDDLVVRPKDRERGVASMLITEVIRFATEGRMGRLFLLTHEENGRAQRVYAGKGFQRKTHIPFFKHLHAMNI